MTIQETTYILIYYRTVYTDIQTCQINVLTNLIWNRTIRVQLYFTLEIIEYESAHEQIIGETVNEARS